MSLIESETRQLEIAHLLAQLGLGGQVNATAVRDAATGAVGRRICQRVIESGKISLATAARISRELIDGHELVSLNKAAAACTMFGVSAPWPEASRRQLAMRLAEVGMEGRACDHDIRRDLPVKSFAKILESEWIAETKRVGTLVASSVEAWLESSWLPDKPSAKCMKSRTANKRVIESMEAEEDWEWVEEWAWNTWGKNRPQSHADLDLSHYSLARSGVAKLAGLAASRRVGSARFVNCHLSDESLATLINALPETVVELDMSYNNGGPKAASALRGWLERGNAVSVNISRCGRWDLQLPSRGLDTLLNLSLSANSLTEAAHGVRLAEFLDAAKRLLHFRLDWNALDGLALFPAVGRHMRLQTLDISANAIARQGALAAAKAMFRHPSLTDINLSRNRTGNDKKVVKALAEAALVAPKLTRLNIDHNPLGKHGSDPLKAALSLGNERGATSELVRAVLPAHLLHVSLPGSELPN